MPIDPKLMQNYAAISEQIETLETELDTLKEHIVGAMMSEDVRKVASEVGTFILAERAKWEYSPLIKDLETKLKEEKKGEEKTGVAKAQTISYLTFKP